MVGLEVQAGEVAVARLTLAVGVGAITVAGAVLS
jgi:hypothetical protein